MLFATTRKLRLIKKVEARLLNSTEGAEAVAEEPARH